MNIWNEIDEDVMRALSGVIYSIWESVGFSIEYDEVQHELELMVYDKSYMYDNKKVVFHKKFNYEIKTADILTKANIVSMIGIYLTMEYCPGS